MERLNDEATFDKIREALQLYVKDVNDFSLAMSDDLNSVIIIDKTCASSGKVTIKQSNVNVVFVNFNKHSNKVKLGVADKINELIGAK